MTLADRTRVHQPIAEEIARVEQGGRFSPRMACLMIRPLPIEEETSPSVLSSEDDLHPVMALPEFGEDTSKSSSLTFSKRMSA